MWQAKWQAFGISDQGCVRANNEDAYHIAPERGLYVVADGMGGAQAGERASRLAIDTLAEDFAGADGSGPDALTHAFQSANKRVMDTAASDTSLDGMGTTLVAALASGPDMVIASVGDSRAYIHDGQNLLIVTEDQTWVHEVGRKLGMDDEALRVHPMRHMLTMAIGLSRELRIHSYSFRPSAGTQVLLCSDGLHGVVPHEKIAATLGTDASLEAKCRDLVEAAREAGGPDNITAILLRYSE